MGVLWVKIVFDIVLSWGREGTSTSLLSFLSRVRAGVTNRDPRCCICSVFGSNWLVLHLCPHDGHGGRGGRIPLSFVSCARHHYSSSLWAAQHPRICKSVMQALLVNRCASWIGILCRHRSAEEKAGWNKRAAGWQLSVSRDPSGMFRKTGWCQPRDLLRQQRRP